jgi:hypothetical protein
MLEFHHTVKDIFSSMMKHTLISNKTTGIFVKKQLNLLIFDKKILRHASGAKIHLTGEQ